MKGKTSIGVLLALIGLIFFSANGLAAIGLNDSHPSRNSSLEITSAEGGKEMEISGTVESLEGKMTAWMYGTHLLINNETGERYALKSDAVNLSEFNGEYVTLKGNLIHDGTDTGPPYVEVTEVQGPKSDDTVESLEDGNGQERILAAGILVFVVAVSALVLRARK